MTSTRPQVDIRLPEISHIAFVVEDLEAGMRRFGRLLGLEPWLIYRYESPQLSDTTFRGAPGEYSMRVAITDVEGPIDWLLAILPGEMLARVLNRITDLRDRVVAMAAGRERPHRGGRGWDVPNPGLPGVNVELIEPLEGPSTYTEFLDGEGTGIHHIGCFAFDEPRTIVDAYRDAGISLVQSGRFTGLEFWYLDLRDELDGLILEIAADLWAIPEPDGVFPG